MNDFFTATTICWKALLLMMSLKNNYRFFELTYQNKDRVHGTDW